VQNLNSAPAFYQKIPGKWILAGEHTVLRGGKALVFPLTSQYLEIFYFTSEMPFEITLRGENSLEIQSVVNAVFARALETLKIQSETLTGQVILQSNILFGAGMGASATLCVAVAEFFHFLGYVSTDSQKEPQTDSLYEFARQLENLFHGESSGVDIAVVLRKKPLLFSREQGIHEIENYHMPQLYLSHTGAQGITKDCVTRVKNLGLDQPQFAKEIDERMMSAVSQFSELLNHQKNEAGWIDAMNKAHSCFRDWGLMNQNVKNHEELLLKHGALAVKLTGSGGGGFMLSLWNHKPIHLPFNLIPCTEK